MAITATFVALEGVTSGGYVTTSRVYSADQPVDGRVRKSSGAPYYQTSLISDVVDSSTGMNATIVLIVDQ